MHEDDAVTGGALSSGAGSAGAVYDDDALASALEAEAVRLGFTAALSLVPTGYERPPLPAGPTVFAAAAVAVANTPLLTRRALREAERAHERAGASEHSPVQAVVGVQSERPLPLISLWFSANASVLGLALGVSLLTLGLSLRQAIIAAVLGLALSVIPIGFGTLAAHGSGQRMTIVSRATFGMTGNLVPALLALLIRLFWGSLLLWFSASAMARVLVLTQSSGDLSEGELKMTVLALLLGLVVVAVFGLGRFARLRHILTMLLTVAVMVVVIVLIVATAPSIDLKTALSAADGPLTLVVTGAVLVFSFVGLISGQNSGVGARGHDLANPGRSSMLRSLAGVIVPVGVVLMYGAILAASNPEDGQRLTEEPIDEIVRLLPGWSPTVLIALVGVSLLPSLVGSLHSGALVLQSVGFRLKRVSSTLIVAALIFASAVTFSLTTPIVLVRDLAMTLAVPIAAWSGIFVSQTMRGRRHFAPDSRSAAWRIQRGGRWINFGSLLAATALGYGFTTASASWLDWQGYLFTVLGTASTSAVGQSDIGVLLALALGLLTPVVARRRN